MLLPYSLKILDKFVSVREDALERKSETAVKRLVWERKKSVFMQFFILCGLQPALFVSFDSSWDRNTQRLERILWVSSRICACCSVWISVLSISSTCREADSHVPFRKMCLLLFVFLFSHAIALSWSMLSPKREGKREISEVESLFTP